MTGLIASIAALNQFGYRFIDALVRITPTEQTIQAGVELQQAYFYGQLIFHCTIAFFSYQVVARLAEGAAGNRFGDKVREGFQRRFIGAIIGAFNGYLLVGGIWSFLEHRLTQNGYEPLPLGEPYPFPVELITRPIMTADSMGIVNYLPLSFINPNLWLLLFFVAFFIVIVALI
jgi:hypothetical protein